MNNPFQVLGGKSVEESNKSLPIEARIQGLIGSSPIFLFMKGSPEMPQCGFSANVVQILNHYQVSFNSFNILSDMDIREGVKAFSSWPTYPQLYIKGQLIGGSDIITEMHKNGELKEMLKLS